MPTLFYGDDENYRKIAEIISHRREEKLHRDLESVPSGPLIVVASQAGLTKDNVLGLQRRLLTEGPEEGGFGIITGRTPDAALSLYERSAPNRSQHCIILRRENKTIISSDEETSIYNLDSATTEAIKDFMSEDAASLSMMIDGLDTHLHLTDGAILGYPSNQLQNSERRNDDKTNLFADQIDVPHIFLNSCSSTIPGRHDKNSASNVGMSLLERTTSLIAGYRVREALPIENALYYALLRAGYDAAEICYILTKNAHKIDIEAYPYIVFGNPNARLPKSERSTVTASVLSGKNMVIEVDNVSTHIVEVAIDTSRVAEPENVILKNLIKEQRDWPLFYTAFQDGNETRIIIYSWGKINTDKLKFRVVSGRGHPGIAIASASIRNAEQLERLGLLGSKAHGQLTDLKNRATSLPEGYDRRRYDANAYRDLESRVEVCLSSVENIEERLVSYLEGRAPGTFLEDYIGRVVRQEVNATDETCPYCGDPVVQKVLVDITGTTKRVQVNCPTCMNIYDIPSVHDKSLRPLIDMPEKLTVGETANVEISFENPTDTPIKAVFYPWLWGEDEQRGTPVYNPMKRRTTIEPSDSYTATYEFDTSGLPPRRYAQFGFVIGNLNIYTTARQLRLTKE